MRGHAEALRPRVDSPIAVEFIEATAALPTFVPRTLHRHEQTRKWHTAAEAAAMSDEQRAVLKPVSVDEQLYYYTKYGSPLAYARPIDQLGSAGLRDLAGARILDYGYGTIGHLKLLALCGAQTVGVDVDPFLITLYSESGDQGELRAADGTGAGSVRLVHGRWPGERAANDSVGGGYDVIISKNTLKRGYVHPPPDAEVDTRQLIDLGVDDETFVRAMHDALKPGGLVMIYNICPKPAAPGEKFIPWADGRCPFERQLLERGGFEVVAFDVDDSPAARAQGRALGWDQGEKPMDLENDCFAWYTLLRRQGNGQ
jgi:SAM-dependent methyltransferase